MEKNVHHEHYQAFKWKRMLAANITFWMKENACHKHCICFKWRKICVINTTNTAINQYEEYIFYLFNINKNIRTAREIVSYHTILITDLSLVRKQNILLWECKTGKVYILHARHVFLFVVYIFFEHKIF